MMMHMRLANAATARVFRLLHGWRFGSFGRGSQIVAPIAVEGAARIYLGSEVYVAHQTCLAAKPHTGNADCRLEIGDGSRIGRFNHIYATRRIVIGAKVLTANNVYISDNLHGYRDPLAAVLDQPIEQLGDVEIGDGSWLGQNVCVIGAKVGSHCIVGANAVVTKDLPDYSVAVGAPAIVVRRYDSVAGTWRRTRSDGAFQHADAEQGDAA